MESWKLRLLFLREGGRTRGQGILSILANTPRFKPDVCVLQSGDKSLETAEGAALGHGQKAKLLVFIPGLANPETSYCLPIPGMVNSHS